MMLPGKVELVGETSMAGAGSEAKKVDLEERRLQLEERRFAADQDLRIAEQTAKVQDEKAKHRQATFDRRYRLLELKERRADRGNGIKFTAGQATVAAAILAVVSGIIGALIQGWFTKDVAAANNRALIAVEKLKAEENIALEKQKQDAAERLDRAKFETTLILKAVEAPKRDDQIKNLKFFLTAGFIKDPDGKLAKIDEGAYPSLPPAVSSSGPADLYRDLKGATGLVKVVGKSDDGHKLENLGTCFVISKNGYALTAAQLFTERGGSSLSVSVSLGSNYAPTQPATLIKLDKELDLAIIKLDGDVEYQPFTLSHSQVLIADPVTIMGFPLGQELTLVLGNVTSVSGPGGNITINASVHPGQAGSPVLNKKGEVIAIIHTSNQLGGLAVPIQFINPLWLER
jgi:S1-C subfamily serine protease